jgi:hypothetical protein
MVKYPAGSLQIKPRPGSIWDTHAVDYPAEFLPQIPGHLFVLPQQPAGFLDLFVGFPEYCPDIV